MRNSYTTLENQLKTDIYTENVEYIERGKLIVPNDDLLLDKPPSSDIYYL